MTNYDKAVDVLERTGRTRHVAGGLSEAELADLAEIYDAQSDATLKTDVAQFWANRWARQAELKATVEEEEESRF